MGSECQSRIISPAPCRVKCKKAPSNWALLAFPADRDKALAFGVGSDYFALIFNASELVSGDWTRQERDIWLLDRRLLQNKRGWSRHRLIAELQGGAGAR